ncbi:hypothetical protein [uncultured Alistipes sp.]|uniref:hypothetical protein n=2 Tax=uncultured Alistipes sp. TaxID=538949 RepID=UPI0025E7FCD7|nr:hypothetical protein [uncultured Alistipes sp.]
MALQSATGKTAQSEMTTSEAYMRTVNKISGNTRNWLVIMGAVQDLRDAMRHELEDTYSPGVPNRKEKFDEFQAVMDTVKRFVISEMGSSIYSRMLREEGTI